jgi:hypothetical protein
MQQIKDATDCIRENNEIIRKATSSETKTVVHSETQRSF